MTKAVLSRLVLVIVCIGIGLFYSCAAATPQDSDSTQDATISVQNNFATDITFIEYDAVGGTVPILAGAYAEKDITLPADRTGLHKILLTTGGVPMISIDPVYTMPGGYTKIVLSPSQCTPL
jgi:hypothetical protein